MPCPSARLGRHWPRSRGGGRAGARPCSPRGRTGRARAAGETRLRRGARAVLRLSRGISVGNWFCFLEHHQHEEEDDDKEETHPASTLIWNQKLLGCGLGVWWHLSTWSHSGGAATPLDSQQGQAQGRGRWSPNASRHCRISPTSGVCPNSGHREDRSPLLPVLNSSVLFRQKLKAKKKQTQTQTHSLNLPHQKPTPSPWLGILACKAPL